MCSNATYVLNGQTVSRYENKYDSTKLVTVLPVKGEDGYTIEKQEGVSYYVVSVHGQVDEYFADGTANPNGAGITLVLDSTKVENPGADVLENVESVAIVNEYIDGSFGYVIENGVLKAYVGNRNSHSGTIRLQVTQYDANDNIVATGIIALGTVAKN